MSDYSELITRLRKSYNSTEVSDLDFKEGPWVPAHVAYDAADALLEEKAWGDRMEAARNRDFDQAMQNGAAANSFKKDAERYRWLRNQYAKGKLVPSVKLGLDDADQFDSAIDGAMANPPSPAQPE